MLIPYQFAIVGPSGRGKTYSFRNMNIDTCGFINMEGKPLPFINKFKHYYAANTWQDAYAKLIEFAKNPEITEVVFDSLSSYMDSMLKSIRETKRGFDIWSAYNDEVGKFLYIVKKYPKHLFITAHTDTVTTEEGIAEKRIAVKGSEWNKVGIEKDFTIVNYVGIKIIDGKKEYVLYLNSDGKDSAKTPPFLTDALSNPEYIPNDAKILLDTLNKELKNNN